MIKGVIRYKPPEAWGVLCIDVWDNNGTNDKFYQGVVDNLSQYNIKLIVNCTLDQQIEYSNRSVFNTLKQYVWDQDPSIPNDIKLEVRDNLIINSGQRPISKILNNHLFDEHSVCLNSSRTFEYHVQSCYQDIRDWIVVGGAWGICVHAGPLGVGRTLKELPAHKFHVFPEWSVQNEDQSEVTIQQIEDDEFVWAPIDHNGYRLVTKMGGKWTRN